MGRSERSERDSLPPNGAAPSPRKPATGGPAPPDKPSVRSASSWLTRCTSCALLPQPTPSERPTLGVAQPPRGARALGVAQPPRGARALGVAAPPRRPMRGSSVLRTRCIQAPPENHREPATTEAAAMGRSERSERDSLPPNGAAPSPRKPATGGPAPPDKPSVRSAASWLTRCTSCAPLPQPTPSRCPTLSVVQPPGNAQSWVWSNPLGCPVLGVVQPPSGHRSLHRGRTASAVYPGTHREPPRTRHDRGCGNGSQ